MCYTPTRSHSGEEDKTFGKTVESGPVQVARAELGGGGGGHIQMNLASGVSPTMNTTLLTLFTTFHDATFTVDMSHRQKERQV